MLSNFARGPTFLSRLDASELMKTGAKFLASDHEETVIDSLWVLSGLSSWENECLQDVFALGVVPKLIEICRRSNASSMIPALRTLGNLAAGDDLQTQHLLNAGLLDILVPLLSSTQPRNIRKEAFWILSNILAGTIDQIEMTRSHHCLDYLKAGMTDTDFLIKKEALHGLTNLTKCKQINKLVGVLRQLGLIEELVKALSHHDSNFLYNVLVSIHAILRAGTDYVDPSKPYGSNEIAVFFAGIGGITALEDLQAKSNETIYNFAVAILKEHFGLDDVIDIQITEKPVLFSFAG